jgi:GT2 family glycosyltransferase
MVNNSTALIVTTINRFDLLDRFLFCVSNQTVKPGRVVVVDNSGGRLNQHRLKRFKFEQLEVVTANNLGVAASWNLGLELNNSQVFISNDDQMLLPTGIESMLTVMDEHPLHPIFSGQNENFAFFGTHPAVAKELIGLFDEAFYPAYYEDVDYYHRMKLAGVGWKTPKRQVIDTPLTESVMKDNKSSRELIACIKSGQVSNHCRYIQKWGGQPGDEIFNVPFNMKRFDVCEAGIKPDS